MKVLVISHNVFCETANMGKTLMTYFQDWDCKDIAQLYIHSEVPTNKICTNYYRMTDKEIIKSIFTRKSGTILREGDIQFEALTARTDVQYTAKLYQKARKRTPFIYFMRNLWWSLGKWNTSRLFEWIEDFNPDVVFLASGDYAFIYRIARTIAKRQEIPLVVSCVDDYYFYNKNESKLGGKRVHNLFMKEVRKTIDSAACLFCICDKMSNDYAAEFCKPTYTLFTSASFSKPLLYEKTNALSYIGNLGYNRHEALIQMGRALKNISCPNKVPYIDVYSAESRPEILKGLTEENGIRFHGKISATQVQEIMGRSLAVIHTESFDNRIKKLTAYSVSTKIADSLLSGTCLLAYGPEDIASIDYLKKNGVAHCITSENALENGLIELFENASMRQECISRALKLAGNNHNGATNGQMMREVLQRICHEQKS